MTKKPVHFSHLVPFLPVANLKETIAYYKEKLGFYDEWFWTNPDGAITDAGCRRDDMRLLFSQSPEFLARINGSGYSLDICWFVSGVDAVYEELKAKNVKIIDELSDKPWGMREFAIQDINGYNLRIGGGTEKE
jgi:uncharacterized glyoxalase superfamily protein PhnB